MVAITYLGLLIAVIGGIGFLIAAFRASIWWGLSCLLLTPVYLIFLIAHWDEAKNPFFLQLIGFAVMFLGLFTQEMANMSQVTI